MAGTVDLSQPREEAEVMPTKDFLRFMSQVEKDEDNISVDHAYSKSWDSHSDSARTKPARLLFMKGLFNRHETAIDEDESIDVCSVSPEIHPPFDNSEVRKVILNQSEQFLESFPGRDIIDESEINKTRWTDSQKRIFKSFMKILDSSRLSKLANANNHFELARRQTYLSKFASKTVSLFSSYTWDLNLLGWLHSMMMTLDTPLVSEYFDILKVMKEKVSSLVDKLVNQGISSTSYPHLFPVLNFATNCHKLLNDSEDSIYESMDAPKPGRLTGNPLILLIPNLPLQESYSYLTKRNQFYQSQLGGFGEVMKLPVDAPPNASLKESLTHIMTSAHKKITEVKHSSPKRPVILFGWSSSSLIACQIALKEPVKAVICMGFLLQNCSGVRGDLDDPFLDIDVPTLFVIGQSAYTCSIDDIEDLRGRMKAMTGLVAVGGADDHLRMSRSKMISEGLTQTMVDKCIMNEIENFLVPLVGQQKSVAFVSPMVPKVKTAEKETRLPSSLSSTPDGDNAHGTKRPRKQYSAYSPNLYDTAMKKPKTVGHSALKKPLSSSSNSDSSSETYENQARKNKHHSKSKSLFDKPKRNYYPRLKIIPEKKQPLGTKESEESPKKASVPKDPAKMLAEQQKNGPVDVEKAFGKDSSFLPRPLSPAEFDAPLPQEGALQLDSILLPPDLQTVESHLNDGQTSLNVSQSNVHLSSGNSNLVDSTVSTAETSELQSISLSSTIAIPAAFTSIVSSTAQKPEANESEIEANKTCITTIQKILPSEIASVTASNNKTVISVPSKVLSSSMLNLKQVQNLVSSLRGKNLPSTSQTVLLNSSGSKTATFLVPAGEGSTPKSVQLRRMVVRGPPKNPIVSKLTPANVESILGQRSESQVGNLSLQSDIAGLNEPIHQMVNKKSATTLVKLATTLEPGLKTVKRIKVIEAMPSSSMPTRFETAEEVAEKQRAIRALNSSLNEDNESDPPITSTYSLNKTVKLNSAGPSRSLTSSYLGSSNLRFGSQPPMYMPMPPRMGARRGVARFPLVKKNEMQYFNKF